MKTIPPLLLLALAAGCVSPAPTPAHADGRTITLTGVMRMDGTNRAVLRVEQPARAHNVVLSEGQKEGAIEVVRIDAKKGIVEIKDAGQKKVLDIRTAAPEPGRFN